MRFTPLTFMASRGECVKAYSNGSTSGSFESGSRVFVYHEFKLSNDLSSSEFQFVVQQGYTSDARVVLIGGGGGGGWDGTDSYGLGGGGGGGAVIDSHQVLLSPNTYSIRVGSGGLPADADNANPTLRTYNGGDGVYSNLVGPFTNLQANGGEGGIGQRTLPGGSTNPEFARGGQSGTPFDGGRPASGSGGRIAAGGGGGSTSIGQDGYFASAVEGGDGGSGSIIFLPYTSPTWNASTKAVGGGGGGGVDPQGSVGNGGSNNYGGGRGSNSQLGSADSGDRYTGGGGGGGASYAYTPPDGSGTTGGDGLVIIYYPVTDCYNEGSGSFLTGSSLLNACTSPTTKTLFYNKMYYTNLQVGSVLYTDRGLLTPVANSYIVSGSEIYVVSGSTGVVSSITACSNTVSMASGSLSGSACTSTTFNNYYYSGSLVVGTSLYTDYGRTNLVPNNFYKKSGTFDLYQTSTGVINSITSCSMDCKNVTFNGGNSGGTITFYDCTNSFQSANMNRLVVFTTCVNVNRPITTGGTTSYTTGSAC